MNTKNLIIAFITVSIAALIVSAFAVFAAAQSRYQALLASAEEAKDTQTEDVPTSPETTADAYTTSVPETSVPPETSDETTESETAFEETEIPAPSFEETSVVAEESTTVPSGYTLKLEGDRLIMRAPDGTTVCERIIDASSLHPKDRKSLCAGLSFADESEAMSAICDIIS